ncbi:MAG TPA: hypothetical protein DCE41_15860 [Cytophagales bacterium]|nr:hypothetical protein [Cytophagales bacterium]
MSKILNGKKSFGIDKLFNILSAFPLLNPVWLLLGKGPQYLEGGFDYQSLTQQVNAQEIEILRLKAKLEVYEDLIKYRTTQHPPKDEE